MLVVANATPDCQAVTPRISIVVEWDNARLSSEDRSVQMLQALRAQALDLACPVEVLVLFDSDQIDGDKLAGVETLSR
jgi:hypothetical protein